MRKLTDNPGTVFPTVAKAEAIARMLADEDEDFAFVVRADPKGSGRAVIDVFDRTDNTLIGQV